MHVPSRVEDANILGQITASRGVRRGYKTRLGESAIINHWRLYQHRLASSPLLHPEVINYFCHQKEILFFSPVLYFVE